MNNTSSQNKSDRPNVYHIVTERIINALKTGVVPWHQPWVNMASPRNFLSGAPYRGVNALLLRLTAHATPYWLTQSQIELRGGMLKEGARSQIVTFWKSAEKVEPDASVEEKQKQRAILRYYRVYNYADCEGLPPLPLLPGSELKPHEAAEAMIANMPLKPNITRNGDQAFYSIRTDTVNIPDLSLFTSLDSFYNVWLHELGHATRHSSRLDRRYHNEQPDSPRIFGSCDYSREELVAELTAAFLCAELGLENHVPQSASYISGWLSALEGDERLLIHAAAAAQKAADFVAGRHQQKNPAGVVDAVVGTKAKRIAADMAAD